MPIRIGTESLNKAYVGSEQLNSIYLGTTLLYGGQSDYDYIFDEATNTLTIFNAPYRQTDDVLTII